MFPLPVYRLLILQCLPGTSPLQGRLPSAVMFLQADVSLHPLCDCHPLYSDRGHCSCLQAPSDPWTESPSTVPRACHASSHTPPELIFAEQMTECLAADPLEGFCFITKYHLCGVPWFTLLLPYCMLFEDR